ncbi:PDR/VanB family oxidoreductase [Paraburkholderia rhynchosiae]|uniref:Oxidoreductase n=1 Tax=Paraburkholderia rhynchosiae TaxID=487049 RepID=A0A2N7WC01_9BURK|nr:PDR/VanB family oxidoreductase [Paraburkholderia rhynchosiae]PMS26921.1 oxidoreductase [Paraburkholderia rhynchosiae]CAB3726997.1 Tetrachlorobenzoquinone reductase [Paraburkholderia rhynchosiae]
MIEVVVTALRDEAQGVLGIELRAADGALLPPFEPGAHVDVHLPGGLTRQYSLCNDASETARYCIGVGLSALSRGGSAYVHEKLREGDRLMIGEPRALFRLSPDAARHRFIAGGIGITPILAMIRWCARHALPWELHYCVRSRLNAAYLHELSLLGGHVHLYADDEEAVHLPRDVGPMMCDLDPTEHVYCCGPGGLMDAVAAQGERLGLPPQRQHFERFTAPVSAVQTSSDSAFTVVLARQGVRCNVEADESILGSLERHGICPPFSCREGLCRSCEVVLLAGEADHRDYVLSDDEQRLNKSLIICVSRANSRELIIDL